MILLINYHIFNLLYIDFCILTSQKSTGELYIGGYQPVQKWLKDRKCRQQSFEDLNLAVEVMREIGIDISANQTRDVFDFFKGGRIFNYVITVCDAAKKIHPGI